ncbi:SCNM1 protein, partial [Ibidorhyncha struthersii]|nr:SCNM1 protein [Ibidorhyncha struthersii]
LLLEGNEGSPGPLGLSQKRRVADLLANYIPEDEALLLRSGRYACTVCAHRPVFDTLDVLTVHRAGKKHTGNVQAEEAGAQVGADAPSPPHQTPGQAPLSSVPSPQGSPAPLLARTRRIARSALLKAAPYSSCCRRTGAEGSSLQAGVTQTGPSAAPTLPEPLRKDREAAEASPAALLPGHHCRQAGSKGKASSSALSQPEALSPERRQALERYLQLRSAGWIQDRSGKWVKDENAEFDSDEDEPPVLLPA